MGRERRVGFLVRMNELRMYIAESLLHLILFILPDTEDGMRFVKYNQAYCAEVIRQGGR